MEWNYYNRMEKRTKVKWRMRILRKYVVGMSRMRNIYRKGCLLSVVHLLIPTLPTFALYLPAYTSSSVSPSSVSVTSLPPSFFFPHGLSTTYRPISLPTLLLLLLLHMRSFSAYSVWSLFFHLLHCFGTTEPPNHSELSYPHQQRTHPRWILSSFFLFLCFSLLNIISSEIWSRKEDNNTQEDFS